MFDFFNAIIFLMYYPLSKKDISQKESWNEFRKPQSPDNPGISKILPF